MIKRLIAPAAVLGLLALVLAGAAGGTPNPSAPAIDEPSPPPNCINSNQVEAPCAEIRVTKLVAGTAEVGTTFPVVVDCPDTEDDLAGDADGQGLPPGLNVPVNETLTFPAGGGTQSLFFNGGALCTISEVPPAGCTLVSIDPPTVAIEFEDFRDQVVFSVTVTNDCPAAQPAAAAAAAVPAEPSFTG